MTALATDLALAKPDDVYQMMVDAYAGLSESDVAGFHACLTMLMINQIGDAAVISEAIDEALRITRQRKPG